MKFDKNQILGYALLAILLFIYIFYNAKQQDKYRLQQKAIQDSLAQITNKQDQVLLTQKSANLNKGTTELIAKETKHSIFLDTIETSLFTAILSNRGATLHSLYLKNYQSSNPQEKGKTINLINPNGWLFNYALHWSDGLKEVKDLYFPNVKIEHNDQKTQVIYTIEDENKRVLQHIYSFEDGDYRIGFRIKVIDNGKAFFDHNTLNVSWRNIISQKERNLVYERSKTEFSFLDENQYFDFFTLGNGVEEKPKNPLKWVSMRQQFFNTTLISNSVKGLLNTRIEAKPGSEDSGVVAHSNVYFQHLLSENGSVDLSWFFGPNDYKILGSYNLELERLVDLGQGVFSFAKYINKAIVIPLFNFLSSFIENFGLVILCLTILIRFITSPFLYSSYKSSAKMKILHPEIEALKKKYGNDEQALNLKRMELYRQAGVNPLQGCLPVLFQIPIFLALFYFFSSNIALRQQMFWWADDLSSYDSIYDLGFKIPLYGDHISLFTILNVITSLVTAFMNRNSMMDQSNPMMKYMPYFMPIVFLGLFNDLPAALTWYYTISNTITIIFQVVIQKFIINHNKLVAQIETNKKKPKKKSIWLQKAEEMQAARKNQINKK